MTDPETAAGPDATALAAALVERIKPLADAASEAARGVEQDEAAAGLGEGSDLATELISAVIERVEALEADCRRLLITLDGFQALATAPPGEGGETAEPAFDPDEQAFADHLQAPQAIAPEAVESEDEDEYEDEVEEQEKGAGETEPAPAGAGLAASGGSSDGEKELAESEPPAPGEEAEPVHVSEGVRLLATQMSVAGASGDEIARRLRGDFGVQDAERLIAELFGGQVP